MERARAGEGPSLVEALTYRHGGHSRADPGKYRPADEIEAWMERDPIPMYHQRLLRLGVEEGRLADIQQERGRGDRRGDRVRQGGASRRTQRAVDQRLGRRGVAVAELTYREAVAYGIAQEMRRDPSLVMLGEDIAGAGGVFKTTVGLLDEFGPLRVRDTPISEQAILGAAMGAAMTGVRLIAEIMFSDFLAVCWDIVANEIAKTRYMTAGQVSRPLVIRTANGGGSRFGAQHSQSVENWAMSVPGSRWWRPPPRPTSSG